MVKIIHHILHWLSVAIATLIILFAVVLSSLHLFNPYLAKHHAEIENLVSQFMRQPVSVGKITIGGNGLQPVLRFRDVVIFNDPRTAELFKARELKIGIDLVASIIKRKIEPSLLMVKGTKIAAYRDQTGIKIGDAGQPPINTTLPVALTDALEWLFTQGSVILYDVNIVWLNQGITSNITNLQLRLTNDMLQHNMSFSGQLTQPGFKHPAKFDFKLGIQGDILQLKNLQITGIAKIEDTILDCLHNSNTGFFDFPFTGDIELYLSNAQLKFPQVLRTPVVIDDFNGRVQWQHDRDLTVSISSVNAHLQQLTVNGKFKFTLPENGSPLVDFSAGFNLTNIAQVKNFFPVNVINKVALDWLDHAFTGNRISGTLVLKGPLDKFPFDHNEGQFVIDTDLYGINLNYHPEWPGVENIYGKLIFSGRGMQVFTTSAMLDNIPLQHVEAKIADLENATLTLEDDNIQTLAKNGMHFIYVTPLRDLLGYELQNLDLVGNIKLRLQLLIPLSTDDPLRISGDLTFIDNILNIAGSGVAIKKMHGILHFTENDFTAHKFTAELFASPIAIDVTTKTQPVSVVNIDIRGRILLDNVQQFLSDAFKTKITGSSKYTARIQFYSAVQRQNDVVKVTSDLQGLRMALPYPLSKKTDDKRDLQLSLGFSPKPQLNIKYDKFLTAAVDFAHKDVSVKITRLNWSEWQPYLSLAGGGNWQHLTCEIEKFTAWGWQFPNLEVTVDMASQHHLVTLDGPKISGTIIIPEDLTANVITANLDRLYLEATQGTVATSAINIIPLQLQITDFHYHDNNFGKVILNVMPQGGGIVDIQHLVVTNSDFNFDASGVWRRLGKVTTSVRGKISSPNVGSAFEKFSLSSDLVGGQGEMSYDLTWQGSPEEINLRTMQGDLALKVTHGRTAKLGQQTENEIEVVRILNILSLPTLPRRLTLDFSDLTKTGFTFDTLRGNLHLQDGILTTHNTRLEGPVADIFISGKIGVLAKDYDLNLVIFPHLTSSVPVIATLTGGPIVGAISFVADRLLKKGATEMMAYGYYVKGPWSKPTIQKLTMQQIAAVVRKAV